MKTKPYFQTIINCKSIEEREDRIAELALRGFTVARYFERVKESNYTSNISYNDADGVRRRQRVSSAFTSYGAVLRKEHNVVEI